jgi:mono/diheme cytochrome c family protein
MIKYHNLNVTNFVLFLILIFAVINLNGCSKNEDIGIGPVKKVILGTVDKSLSEKGKQIFDVKCIICHRFDSKLVGPALDGVTNRRKPEWIMNIILNPEQMLKEDIIAKQLFAEYHQQMTFQNVTQDEARAILEYFRMNDEQK